MHDGLNGVLALWVFLECNVSQKARSHDAYLAFVAQASRHRQVLCKSRTLVEQTSGHRVLAYQCPYHLAVHPSHPSRDGWEAIDYVAAMFARARADHGVCRDRRCETGDRVRRSLHLEHHARTRYHGMRSQRQEEDPSMSSLLKADRLVSFAVHG